MTGITCSLIYDKCKCVSELMRELDGVLEDHAT